MEKVVKILKEKKSWRRPDVSAVFKNTKMVFEVQLQTTYLNVIVDREEDYKSEDTYIMWFFDSENIEKFRFSEEDIFYANKSRECKINCVNLKK
jgi:competence CoiA-like predicted nuclease